MDAEKESARRQIILWIAVITLAHFVLGTRTHGMHAFHILLASLYLFPIFWASLAFELRGGVAASLVTISLYSAHLLWSWPAAPMANPDQYAMLAVYLFVGVSSGLLARSAERRRWERDEVIRRARRSETLQGLNGLLIALAARDSATRFHGECVGRLAAELGKRLGLTGDRLSLLKLSGLLHAAGKIGLRDDVLFSRERLTPDQIEDIRGHVSSAVELIRSIYGAEEIAQVVATHHEALDGSGYPYGLRDEEISIEGRILRVADMFVALTETRPYREGMSHQEAIEIMAPLVGSKLDPRCFAALEAYLRDQPHGHQTPLLRFQ